MGHLYVIYDTVEIKSGTFQGAVPYNGLRLKEKSVQKVKLGDLVTFECINRDNFEEMIPEGPEIHRMCNNPVSTAGGVDKGKLDTPSWPTCEQLPCKCLGKEGGLTQQEGRRMQSV